MRTRESLGREGVFSVPCQLGDRGNFIESFLGLPELLQGFVVGLQIFCATVTGRMKILGDTDALCLSFPLDRNILF